jgi:hypothetical protein
MASENKKKKLKNAFLAKTQLKNKKNRLKRLLFYTPSQRKFEKQQEMKNEI